jgi:hypothetical protein
MKEKFIEIILTRKQLVDVFKKQKRKIILNL